MSKGAARASWLTVEWLPKYAPELNPIERVWRDLKRHHPAHKTFIDREDLANAITRPSEPSIPNEIAIRWPTCAGLLRGRRSCQIPLYGPRGELNGVFLQDSTIVHLPPDQAARMALQLAVGKPLYVTGKGSVSPLGKVIAAQQIGPSPSQLAQIETPPPHGPGHGRRPPPCGPGGLALAPPPR